MGIKSAARSNIEQEVADARIVAALGRAWERELSDAVRNEGRAVSGGWPGTMSEARMRVANCLEPELVALDRESLARDVYAAARSAWRSRATRDDEE